MRLATQRAPAHKGLHRHASVLAAVLLLAGPAWSEPSLPAPPDESGVVRTADTHHILVRDQTAAAELLREIESVPAARRLRRFEQVARRASIDPSSARLGGDLGTVFEGEMVANFELAIFASGPHEVIAPFQSDFGWHLAYVTRVSQEPVAPICQQSIERAAAEAPDGEKAGIALAVGRADRALLPTQVSALLGPRWDGPYAASDRWAYFQQGDAPRGAPPHWRSVTQHVDWLLARLYVQARPMGCVRSSRTQWVADCTYAKIAMASSADFEGRAGTGRRLRQWSVERDRLQFEAAAPGTLGGQMHEVACRGVGVPGRITRIIARDMRLL